MDLPKNSPFKQLTFTHSMKARPVKVILGTLSHYLYQETTKSVCLFTTAGILPVAQSMEEVEQLIAACAAEGE